MEKEIVFYRTKLGREPFKRWISKLKDLRGAAKIQTRINRLSLGNHGNSRHLQQGVHELKIDYGPGYRIYFAESQGNQLVLLLFGGTKRTQDKDIETAVKHWKSYKTRLQDEH
jgi:putative addiction module killer protein